MKRMRMRMTNSSAVHHFGLVINPTKFFVLLTFFLYPFPFKVAMAVGMGI